MGLPTPRHRRGGWWWGVWVANTPGEKPGNSLAVGAKGRYGIASLIELASIHGQGGGLQVAEVAQRQSIPDR